MVNVWLDRPRYTRIEPFKAHFSAAPKAGSSLVSVTALFDGKPVTDGQTIDLLWLPLGDHTLTATARDEAGWTTAQSATIELYASLESLAGTADRLRREGCITDEATRALFSSTLHAAALALNRRDVGTVLAILRARGSGN